MRWIQEALQLTGPLAGFNGGRLVGPDGRVIERAPGAGGCGPHRARACSPRGASAPGCSPATSGWSLDPDGPACRARAPHGPLRRRAWWTASSRTGSRRGKLVGVTDDAPSCSRASKPSCSACWTARQRQTLADLLPGRDPSGSQQGQRRPPAGRRRRAWGGRGGGARRHAERRADVRSGRVLGRDGQCQRRGEGAAPPRRPPATTPMAGPRRSTR